MAATYISGLAIKHNNAVFLTDDGVVGKTVSIPTPGAGGIIDGDYWAVPITNYGVFTGFNFEPTSPNSTDAPTPDSFHVFRLVMQRGNDYWYVRGSSTYDGDSPANPGYIEVSADAECCANELALPTDIPNIAPCQLMCEFNADNQYFAIYGLPTLTGNLRYFPYGYYNGTALAAATATGYSSKASLLSFLNGSWSTVGTWSWADDDQTILQVVQTDGSGENVLCVQILTVNPSA